MHRPIARYPSRLYLLEVMGKNLSAVWMCNCLPSFRKQYSSHMNLWSSACHFLESHVRRALTIGRSALELHRTTSMGFSRRATYNLVPRCQQRLIVWPVRTKGCINLACSVFGDNGSKIEVVRVAPKTWASRFIEDCRHTYVSAGQWRYGDGSRNCRSCRSIESRSDGTCCTRLVTSNGEGHRSFQFLNILDRHVLSGIDPK